MKKIFVFVMLLFLAVGIFSQDYGEGGFQLLKWGMTGDEVWALHDQMYQLSIDKFHPTYKVFFFEDKLYWIVVRFSNKTPDQIFEALKEKYGVPKIEYSTNKTFIEFPTVCKWKETLYQWNSGVTKILHMRCDYTVNSGYCNTEVNYEVAYINRILFDLKEKKDKEDAIKDKNKLKDLM